MGTEIARVCVGEEIGDSVDSNGSLADRFSIFVVGAEDDRQLTHRDPRPPMSANSQGPRAARSLARHAAAPAQSPAAQRRNSLLRRLAHAHNKIEQSRRKSLVKGTDGTLAHPVISLARLQAVH